METLCRIDGVLIRYCLLLTRHHRRYADVVVHRQLQAALDGGDACYSGEAVALQANQCNERKHAAKNAQVSPCMYLFLAILEDSRGHVPIATRGAMSC